MRRITLLCLGCGNAMRGNLDDADPPETTRMETAACDICDDGGGFDLIHYFALDGRELSL